MLTAMLRVGAMALVLFWIPPTSLAADGLCLDRGDVAIISYESASIASTVWSMKLVALRHLPAGTTFYITSKTWSMGQVSGR